MNEAMLLVGQYDHPEFRDVVRCLEDARSAARTGTAPAGASSCSLVRCDGVVDAIRYASDHAPTAHVFLMLAERQWLARAAVDELLSELPLCRTVGVLGSMFEGAQRTGDLPSGVPFFYWHQLPHRYPGSQSVVERLLQLPRTCSPVERQLQLSSSAVPELDGLVLIATRQLVDYQAHAGVYRMAGCCTAWWRGGQSTAPPSPARVLLWEPGRDVLWNEFEKLQDQARAKTTLALLDFPRWHDVRAARQAGVDHVIAKPYLFDDLLSPLSQ